VDEKAHTSPLRQEKRWLVWSGLYTAVFFAIVCYLNYTLPYSGGPIETPTIGIILFWALLYLPVIALPLIARWEVKDFGFTVSPILAAVSVLAAVLCGALAASARVAWDSAALEAYARTGEELFFRGFLFTFFMRLFAGRRRPWLWAVLLTSLFFSLAHTQTFNQSYLSQNGSPAMPAAYIIFERLANVFGIALVLGGLRAWTRSILPGMIAHGLLNGGFLTLPFVLLIYAAFTFWAYRRGETVAFGSVAQPDSFGPGGSQI